MLDGFYRSTFSPDPVSNRPFAADAIISNPPAFGHVHIAEALGLPLLISFSQYCVSGICLWSAMPWSPTTAFKHPLVNIQKSNAESGLTNYLTYAFADAMSVSIFRPCLVKLLTWDRTWQGLGDIINVFRTDTLGLEPLTQRSGASSLDRLKIPWTYCWSDGLIEKPKDWKEHIGWSSYVPNEFSLTRPRYLWLLFPRCGKRFHTRVSLKGISRQRRTTDIHWVGLASWYTCSC